MVLREPRSIPCLDTGKELNSVTIKISIITATWNSEKTVADTLRSVQSQSYENIEYLVIDGASTDNTLDIVQRDGGHVDRIISEPDKGIYDALNKGIANASGDVVGFLHSDDIYAHKDALRQIADAFTTNNVDAIYGDLDYVSKDNQEKLIRHWKSNPFQRKKMRYGWMPPHPTFYMKTERYRELGSFDLQFKIAADYDSLLRYLWKHRVSVAYIPNVLVKMRLGGASNRSIKNILQKSREDCRAMKNNGVPRLLALPGKNLSKVPQFFRKG